MDPFRVAELIDLHGGLVPHLTHVEYLETRSCDMLQ